MPFPSTAHANLRIIRGIMKKESSLPGEGSVNPMKGQLLRRSRYLNRDFMAS